MPLARLCKRTTSLILESPGSGLSQEQVQKVIDYAIQSLRSAETTDEGILNELYPEFGTRFKRDFSIGQSLLISGLRTNSRTDLERSSELDHAWKDWYNANRKQIESAFNAAVR